MHWAAPRFKNFGKLDQALRYQAELRFDLRDALAKAGGAEAFAACGKATAGKFQRPARRLVPHEHTLDVGLVPAPAGRDRRRAHDEQAAPEAAAGAALPAGLRARATVRTTTLFSTCRRPGSLAPRLSPPAMATVAVPRPAAPVRASCAPPTRCSPV